MGKKICRKCHFLSKSRQHMNNALSKSERDEIKDGKVIDYTLKCYHGVWNETYSGQNDDRLHLVNRINRKRKCFFYPFTEGMQFPAAEELQKRQQENEQLRKALFYTRCGLYLAVFSSLITAIALFIRK